MLAKFTSYPSDPCICVITTLRMCLACTRCKHGHFAIYVCWLLGWHYMYISLLHCADKEEGQNSCPLLQCCFIGSCHVGVSKHFSCSISLAVYHLLIMHVKAHMPLNKNVCTFCILMSC